MSRRRVVAICVVSPLVLSAAVLLLAGLFPVRLDYRTFQALQRLEKLDLPQSNGNFLLLTRDNESDNFQLFAFALPQLTFPNGTRAWLTLKETTTGVWSGGFLGVDASGAFHSPYLQANGWSWGPASSHLSWLEKAVQERHLLYDSEATREEFLRRLPLLGRAQRVGIAAKREAGLAQAKGPTNEFTLVRWLRLACLLGTLVTALYLMWAYSPPGLRALAGGFTVLAALAAWMGLTFIAGQLAASSYGWAPLWLWAAATLLALKNARHPEKQLLWEAKARGSFVLVAVTAALAYTAVMTMRLDFDGDTYSTYIQVARFYHLLGQHSPEVVGQQGLVQADVYPPGFPLFLALPMWLADLPRGSSMNLGLDTSLAVLLYRWLVVVLNAAFLLQLGSYLQAHCPRLSHIGLSAVLAALLVVPMFRGEHVSAETLLVPLVGGAVIAVSAGRRFGLPWLAAGGLFVGGLATLVKIEGLVFLLLLVLPASLAVRSRWSWRTETWVWIPLLLGLIPYALWAGGSPAQNQAFKPASMANLEEGLLLLPALLMQALKIVLRSDQWLVLFLGLPLGIMARCLIGRDPRSSVLAAGIAAVVGLWIAVYMFSALPPMIHMETSFARIMLAPTLVGLVYSFEALGLLTESRVHARLVETSA